MARFAPASIAVESRDRLIAFLERDGPRYLGPAGNLEFLLLEDSDSGGNRVRRYRSIFASGIRIIWTVGLSSAGTIMSLIPDRSNGRPEYKPLARTAGRNTRCISAKRKIMEKALANFSDPLRRDQYFELYAPEIVLHGYDGVGPGIDSVKRYYSAFWDAFPDARVAADDIIEAHDKVVARFSLTDTRRGRILGIDRTAKAIQLTGVTILRCKGQRCVERWSVTDSLAMVVQLGGLSSAEVEGDLPRCARARCKGVPEANT